MISQKAKYALRALVALAKQPTGQPVFIGDIAEAQNIPKKFLEQILLDLKHHGLVASRRGKAGGYGLFRPADTISFGEVLRIIDGPIAPLPCLSRPKASAAAVGSLMMRSTSRPAILPASLVAWRWLSLK